jgi:uncharacterized Ntn-hydrolase superfamily protein
MKSISTVVVLALGLILPGGRDQDRRGATDLDDPVATFSILGYDPESGELGGAVQSRVFSVGNGVLWAEAGVGAVATQAIVDVSYGPQALELLRKGVAPADVIRQVWERDPDPGLRNQRWPKAGRQFAVISPAGETAVFTGPEASEWAGHKQGRYATAQGNILAGPAVVNDMIAALCLHNDVVLRLQVDDNPEPIKELRRLVGRRYPRG